MRNVQRFGFFTLIPGLLMRFGVNPEEVLALTGLRSDALKEPESTIPF